MKDARFHNLYDFMSGYFHQDYLDEYADDAALFQAFKSQSPATLVTAVARELRVLLTTVPPNEITDDFLLSKLGCYGGPAEGTSNFDWLAWVLEQLEHSLRPQ